jgi:hypothetical protein
MDDAEVRRAFIALAGATDELAASVRLLAGARGSAPIVDVVRAKVEISLGNAQTAAGLARALAGE